MIEVFDTAAPGRRWPRRKLRCPDCGQALKPWGRARERTIRELGGALLTVRPDRARCTGCDVTHVVLDAGLLPRRAYAADLAGVSGDHAPCQGVPPGGDRFTGSLAPMT